MRWGARKGGEGSVIGGSHQPHDDAATLPSSVRTIVDLPDDLLQHVLAIGRVTGQTLSQTMVDLIRRGLNTGSADVTSTDPKTRLPLVKAGRVITSEDVRRSEDE